MAMKLRQMTMNLVIHLDHACQRTVDDHLMVLDGVRETTIQVYKLLASPLRDLHQLCPGLSQFRTLTTI
jgi:hypothetical protein